MYVMIGKEKQMRIVKIFNGFSFGVLNRNTNHD